MADSRPPGPWLRFLLWLQPSSIRRDYGGEWLETAARRDRAAARQGWLPWVGHRIREAAGAAGAAVVGRWNFDRGEAGMLDVWPQDLRYGARSLARSPGFMATAVLVLGAGIGATTTIFSGVHAVLLAPLPFHEPDRLVGLWERNPDFGWERAQAAPANVLDWRERVEAFDDVAAYRAGSLGGVTWIDDAGDPRRLATVQVTGNLFEVLGLRPHRGTFPTFDNTWSTGDPWAVVSHGFWTESLGADPDAVGRVLDLDGFPVRVQAVLPPG
ncbi:MAG: ABC transporter permease, partial [Longimicrobiales bacterium]